MNRLNNSHGKKKTFNIVDTVDDTVHALPFIFRQNFSTSNCHLLDDHRIKIGDDKFAKRSSLFNVFNECISRLFARELRIR